MIDGNKFGEVGFKYIGTPYSVMDCQAFVEQCAHDCGNSIDLAGSNAWYRYIMKNGATMTPEDCVKQLGCVPKGAILFIVEHDGKEPDKYKPDGYGNASHMGICTGDKGKGAIHSSASRGCVAESDFKGKTIKNGGWNMVGLWDEVSFDYSGGDTPEPLPAETAIVGNVPEGRRQDVNLRAKPSTNARLIDRVPCGEIVEVISHADDWSKIEWRGEIGYMMTQFLIFPDDGESLYCVTIHDLPIALAEEIAATYGGSITKERG